MLRSLTPLPDSPVDSSGARLGYVLLIRFARMGVSLSSIKNYDHI
jgi:hypothetical protein